MYVLTFKVQTTKFSHFDDYDLLQPKLSRNLFSSQEIIRFLFSQKKVKIHILSKTSVELSIFHGL